MLKRFTPFVAMLFIAACAFGQAQRTVLFEEFTGENCDPCAETNPYVDSLVTRYPNDVIWMRYQSPIPSAGTIYYQDVNDDQTRMTYYGVSFAPWGQQDGAMWDSSANILNNYGNQPITWCTNAADNPVTLSINTSYLLGEYAVPSPFTINVTHSMTTTTDSFYATVTVTGADSFLVSASGDLKLRVAMIEDLNFATPPGSNGETYFPHVVRHMYPSAAGTTLADGWNTGDSVVFNFSGPVPSIIHDKTKVRFVAFVQDDGNLHVQQAGMDQPVTFPLDAAASGAQGSFVQCSTTITPAFSLTNNGTTTLTSCTIQTTVDGSSAGTQSWSGSLAAGNSTVVNVNQLTLTPGTHTLAFIATSPNGGTDANIGNDTTYLSVGVEQGTVASTPLVEGFESASNPGWLSQSVSGLPYGWSRYNTGDSSSYSYQCDFWDITYGDVSNLYAPVFTLSGFTSASMKFDRAYAQYDFGNGGSGADYYSQDSLYIDVSTDCGNSWQTVYSNGASTMATAPQDSLSTFVPSAAQWVNDSADLSTVAGNANVLLRFRAVSDYGNDLYIDNINISGFSTSGIHSINSNVNSLNVYPNPSNTQVMVSLQLNNAAEVTYEVTDVTGQVVISAPAETRSAGQNNFTINTTNLPDGMYFLSIVSGNERTAKIFGVMH